MSAGSAGPPGGTGNVAAPGDAAPGDAAPGEAAPGEAAPGGTAPGGAGPDLLASVINALDGHVCVVARDGAILCTNQRWSNALAAAGSPGAGRVGDDVFAFCASDPPILGALAGDVAAELRAVLDHGAGDRAVKRRVELGGQQRWMVVRIHPVRDSSAAAAVLAAIDITEGMRTQEQLRKVTEEAEALAAALSREKALLDDVISTIPHLVYWKDSAGRYLGCNRAFLDFRGWAGGDEVLGRQEGEVAADDQLGVRLSELERRVRVGGRPELNHRVTVADSTERDRTLLLSVLLQRSPDCEPCEGDNPGGVIGVGADVTLVSELERQLAQATRLESIGQLAAGIAHEINTPVQYVTDNVRFAADAFPSILDALQGRAPTGDVDLEFLDEEIPRAMTESLEGLQRVTDIVRAMKDFSHPGTALEETDLNRAVETTVEITRNEWKHVAAVDLHLREDVGTVACYAGDLKQALLNIVVNAAQAIGEYRHASGQPGLGRITIRTERREETVRIIVADDGPGMEATVRDRIFDPFFTTKEVGKGTGQGLTLARATIVNRHGGSIEVASAPGRGTTFTITLLVAGPPVAAHADA